jgi:hypothetical protein
MTGVGDTFNLARRYVAGLQAAASGALAITVLLGDELRRLHELHGVKAGRPSKQFPHAAGIKWGDLVKEQTGLSEDTAARYIERAKEARKRLPAFAEIANRLMSTPLADLAEKELAEMVEQTRKLLPSEKATQLMLDWGLSKGAHGHAIAKGNGGFHPNALILRAWLAENYAEQPEYLDADFCELPKDVQARFKKEGQRHEERLSKEQKAELEAAQEARSWNETFAPTLLDALAKDYRFRADDEQLRAQIDALNDYLGECRTHLREREQKAGKQPKALR